MIRLRGMVDTVTTTFEHPESFMRLHERFMEAVGASHRLTGAAATGWHSSKALVRRNQMRWYNVVYTHDGVTASFSGDIDTATRLSDPDQVMSWRPEDFYELVVTVDDPTQGDAAEHATAILTALNADQWDMPFERSDTPHPYPDRDAAMGGVIGSLPS